MDLSGLWPSWTCILFAITTSLTEAILCTSQDILSSTFQFVCKVSEWKKNSFVLQLFEASRNEAEQLRRATPCVLILLQRFEDLELGHFAAKVTLVQLLLKNGLVDFLQLGQRKLLR